MPPPALASCSTGAAPCGIPPVTSAGQAGLRCRSYALRAPSIPICLARRQITLNQSEAKRGAPFPIGRCAFEARRDQGRAGTSAQIVLDLVGTVVKLSHEM